ncbi:MAG: hypothetical protein ACPG66_08710, partial [Flavobacteriales bacterium]
IAPLVPVKKNKKHAPAIALHLTLLGTPIAGANSVNANGKSQWLNSFGFPKTPRNRPLSIETSSFTT